MTLTGLACPPRPDRRGRPSAPVGASCFLRLLRGAFPARPIAASGSISLRRTESPLTRLRLAALVLWPTLVLSGFAVVTQHAYAPGRGADAPVTWPADAPFAHGDRPTLVMLAHPRCPCTRAALAELARVMAATDGRLDARVLFLDPHDGDDAWRSSDLWDLARAIPGVQVEADPDGAVARRFGAHTSGQVVVYDARGTLVFAGGLTPGRGHEGDSDGKSLLIDGVLHGFDREGVTDVFGCELHEKEGEK